MRRCVVTGTLVLQRLAFLISMGSYKDAYFVPRDSGLPEAKAWLADNRNHMHPAFSSFARYDDQRARLTPQKQQE